MLMFLLQVACVACSSCVEGIVRMALAKWREVCAVRRDWQRGLRTRRALYRWCRWRERRGDSSAWRWDHVQQRGRGLFLWFSWDGIKMRAEHTLAANAESLTRTVSTSCDPPALEPANETMSATHLLCRFIQAYRLSSVCTTRRKRRKGKDCVLSSCLNKVLQLVETLLLVTILCISHCEGGCATRENQSSLPGLSIASRSDSCNVKCSPPSSLIPSSCNTLLASPPSAPMHESHPPSQNPPIPPFQHMPHNCSAQASSHPARSRRISLSLSPSTKPNQSHSSSPPRRAWPRSPTWPPRKQRQTGPPVV